MPYTIRSATATLMQISPSIEEAAISLGASKLKTFAKITVPMMSSGIISGAILSWVAIVTELSGSIILYNNKTITLTMSTYVQINRGNYGTACAFAAILTVVTILSLLIYIKVSGNEDDIRWLVKNGYSVNYGARNLRRLIQKEIEDPAAEAVISFASAGSEKKASGVNISVVEEKIHVEVS